jgi:hypothetical protein
MKHRFLDPHNPNVARGRSNAEARIDRYGCASAGRWLVERRKSNPPLNEMYVEAYKRKLKLWCRRPNRG